MIFIHSLGLLSFNMPIRKLIFLPLRKIFKFLTRFDIAWTLCAVSIIFTGFLETIWNLPGKNRFFKAFFILRVVMPRSYRSLKISELYIAKVPLRMRDLFLMVYWIQSQYLYLRLTYTLLDESLGALFKQDCCKSRNNHPSAICQSSSCWGCKH